MFDVIRWQVLYIVFPAIVLLALLIASLSIYGYHYTAVQLNGYLLNSILVILFGIFSYYLAQRAFAINERRISLDKIRAIHAATIAHNTEHDAQLSSSEDLATALDLEAIISQTISDQTASLLKMVVAVAVGLALWNVWSEIFPAFKPLQDVKLWDILEIVDGATTIVEITLWNLILAIMTSVITFLAAKNIPGLLEMALLSRLPLATGKSYTFTTIAPYLIVITGGIIVLQLLGAQWSKLQWLVAALSVGVAYGSDIALVEKL